MVDLRTNNAAQYVARQIDGHAETQRDGQRLFLDAISCAVKWPSSDGAAWF